MRSEETKRELEKLAKWYKFAIKYRIPIVSKLIFMRNSYKLNKLIDAEIKEGLKNFF